jgi:hypothetical protein
MHRALAIIVPASWLLLSGCQSTPAGPCAIALIPTPGAVGTPFVEPLKVTASCTDGCTITWDRTPVVVPAGAFTPACTQGATSGNNVVVSCSGVPPPATPPTSALGLSFSCRCESGTHTPNNLTVSYLF